MLALSIAAAVAAAAWAYLVAGHGGYWRTSQWLPPVTGEPDAWPDVAVVVPARNEAAMLPVTLPALLGQAYPGTLRVIVVDDASSDGTAEIAARLGRGAPRPLQVIAGAARPAGWAGKVWAMAQGLAAGIPAAAGAGPGAGRSGPPGSGPSGSGRQGSGLPGSGERGSGQPGSGQPGSGQQASDQQASDQQASDQQASDQQASDQQGSDQQGYVLFTDADIAWPPHALRALVAAAEADDRDLVSQMALLRSATGWERVVVPAFVYFFAQLYPFRRVNAPGSRTAAAAGGCMLVRRAALESSGGLAPISGALIDDVAMGRMIKRQRGRCWLGLSRQVASVRPYPGLASLWQMVARSAYTQLNYSPALLAATIAGLLFGYALPPAAAVTGIAALLGRPAASAPAALAAGAGLAGWALMSLSYLPMLRLYRLSPLRAPGLPLIALLYAAMTADSARRHHAGRGAQWRGRTIPARLPVAQPRGPPAGQGHASLAGSRPLRRAARLPVAQPRGPPARPDHASLARSRPLRRAARAGRRVGPLLPARPRPPVLASGPAGEDDKRGKRRGEGRWIRDDQRSGRGGPG